MKINKGFSLIELLIVIAILGILGAVAIFSWQRYVNNTNLKTAARNIISDFQNCRAKATSESRNYEISFTTGAGGNYTISAPALANPVMPAVSTVKLSDDFGSGIQIVFDGGCGGFFGTPTNVIQFESRGTSNNGCVKLTNSRGSAATITTNITGKAYVNFTLQ